MAEQIIWGFIGLVYLVRAAKSHQYVVALHQDMERSEREFIQWRESYIASRLSRLQQEN